MHEGIDLGRKQKNSLICPNQLRAYGLEVDDVPKFITRGKSIHGIRVDENLILPYELQGRTSFLRMRVPTEEELHECEILQLTSREPWDPEGAEWEDKEKKYEHYQSANVITSWLNKSSKDLPITPDELTTRLGYPTREVTEKTIKATTQLGTMYGHLPMKRHYKSLNHQLRHQTSQVYCLHRHHVLQYQILHWK